jgi:hypothetical protein
VIYYEQQSTLLFSQLKPNNFVLDLSDVPRSAERACGQLCRAASVSRGVVCRTATSGPDSQPAAELVQQRRSLIFLKSRLASFPPRTRLSCVHGHFRRPIPPQHEFVIWPHLTSRNWEKERLKKIAKMNFLNDLFDFFQAEILLLLKRKILPAFPNSCTMYTDTHTHLFCESLRGRAFAICHLLPSRHQNLTSLDK